jgi:DNA-binding NarL/FixJ family response regulator
MPREPGIDGATAGLPPVRVLLVDDQQTFRDVMRAVVEATPALEVAGEASSGEDALASLEEVAPHLVIVDVRMPGMGGVALARALLELTPPPVVLLVSAQPPPLPLLLTSGGEVVACMPKEHLRPASLQEVWEDRAGRRGAALQRDARS